jgi:hypothetical protein
LADRAGRLEDRPAKIKAQLFPYEDADVSKMLDALHPDFVVRYEVAGTRYLQVNNFTKHQHIHPDEKPSVIPENQGIPGNPRGNPEIAGNAGELCLLASSSSSSPSSSPSPSCRTTAAPSAVGSQGGLKKFSDARGEDFTNFRLPKNFGRNGHYGSAYVRNVPADEAAFLLKTMKRLGDDVRRALEWRVALKENEKTPDQRRAAR